ncbi:MAG: phosphoribosylglycinamide formyltransferase [Pirellulaceae bacterium]
MSDAPSDNKLRVAVLISGGGTTLKNLLEKIAARGLPIEVALVVSSSATAAGLQFAAEAGIPSEVLLAKNFADTGAFSTAIFDACRVAGVELVVMGGFLKHVLVPRDFEFRVINIHPSLIPSFCGTGFYGARVHQAALDFGVKVSGCTVHVVDDHYDHGPIIAQRVVPVESGDTTVTLAARVFEAECELYPEVLTAFAEGRVTIAGRHVRVQPSGLSR